MFINEKVDSLLRHILTMIAALLVAKGVVAEANVEVLIGGVIGLASIGWSVYIKDINQTRFEGAMRHILSAVAIYCAYLTPALMEQIAGVITAIGLALFGQTDKQKIQEVKPDKVIPEDPTLSGY